MLDVIQCSQQLAKLFASLGQPDFNEHLLTGLQQQVATDSVVVLLYRVGDKPLILYDGLAQQDREALLHRYFDGAYLLSPFYLAWQAEPQRSAVLRLADITPDGFFESIYFTHYYARSGLKDEIGYVIPIQSDQAVLISLGRTEQYAGFSLVELQLLHAVLPLLEAAMRRHLSLCELPARTPMKNWLEDALQFFGSSRLTGREQGVLQLMLRGHSSKSCARLLGISPATERVHRRNIYTKLKVSSQAELFRLFFDTLSQDHAISRGSS